MADKHTVHLKDGGKVTIDGDRIELHLTGPMVFHRKEWICYLSPREEADRALRYDSPDADIRRKLEEAFSAVPMIVHRESGDE